MALVAACSGDPDSASQHARNAPARAGGQGGTQQPAGSAGSFGNSTTGRPGPSADGGASGAPARSCTASDSTDTFELPVCELMAAPDSFDPKLQWSVELGNGFGPPLVANMTDDNGDGVIDLCDTPDVVVVAGFAPPNWAAGEFFPRGANIFVLDGATGEQHLQIQTTVSPMVTPAIGDIDGDGAPEIIAMQWLLDQFLNGQPLSGLVAFEHTGEVKWQVPLDFATGVDQQSTLGISLHDLEGDGEVEVIVGTAVFAAATGAVKWNADDTALSLSSIVVDLDGDGLLELVTGLRAFDHRGNLVWDRMDLLQGNGLLADLVNLVGVYPLVANFDDDEFPEILIAAGPGVFILEHDGSTKLSNNIPLTYRSNAAGQGLDFGDFKPPTAHDFDGDGHVDVALGAATGFTVLDRMLQPIYQYAMIDAGWTATTAFDFLGDGSAEAIYADKDELLFFDVANRAVVMTWPHSGMLDYPIVVDVDNDDSAEVIVVSGGVVDTSSFFPTWIEKTAPTVQVLTDAMDRWIPTRRIWNMANYHVTHVREDATIPAGEIPHYRTPNTFRTNVQYEAGGICRPAGPD